MRKRLVSTAIAVAAVGALLQPTLAQASAAPRVPSVSVLAGGSKAGTAVVSGHNRPGTRLQVDAGRTQSAHWLQIDYQVQETGYWCGPAATRIALSARMAPPSQGDLAWQLGTTEAGTDHIGQVTGVLNANLGGGWYETKEMPNDPPTQAQRDLLWYDIVFDIDRNYPLVTNIVAPPGNQPPAIRRTRRSTTTSPSSATTRWTAPSSSPTPRPSAATRSTGSRSTSLPR